MEPWQWILSLAVVAVAAVLIPVLLQARRTLHAVEALALATRPKLERTLDEISSATARLNHATATVERQVESVRPMLVGIAGIGQSLQRTRFIAGAVSAVAAAVGPMLASAVGSFFGREEAKVEDEPVAAAEATPLRRPVRTGGES